MPLVAKTLEQQLVAYFKKTGEDRTPEDSAKELAQIITNYIKTATITINGTGIGGNGGGPIATTVTGVGTIV